MPGDMHERDAIVVDPMLATGNSAVAAVERLKEAAAASRSSSSACSTCPEGVKTMQRRAPRRADLHRRHRPRAQRPRLHPARPRRRRRPHLRHQVNRPIRQSFPPTRRSTVPPSPSSDSIRSPPRRVAAAALAAGRARPGARAGQAQGRRGLHRAVRAAVGEPHPQGAEGGRGARRDRVQVHRERHQRRLRARDARVRRAAATQLIVGESFAVEAAARKVAKDYPEDRVPDGLVGQAAGAQLRGVRQLHPGAGLPHRHDRRRHDQDATRSAWSAASRSPR